MRAIVAERRAARRLGAALLAAALAACGEPSSPEDQIRERIAEGAWAAREGKISLLREMVADDYADRRGGDAQSMRRLLAAWLIRRGPLFVAARARSVELAEPARASADIFVAFARTEIPDFDALVDIDADLYRARLALVRGDDGAWRVVSADWEPATLEDLW